MLTMEFAGQVVLISVGSHSTAAADAKKTGRHAENGEKGDEAGNVEEEASVAEGRADDVDMEENAAKEAVDVPGREGMATQNVRSMMCRNLSLQATPSTIIDLVS